MRANRESRPVFGNAAIRLATVTAMTWLLFAEPPARAGVRTSVERYRSGEKDVTIDCYTPTKRGTRPAVLLMHGSGGFDQATEAVYRGIAKNLADRGYVVLIPHYFDRTEHPIGEPLRKGEYEEMAEAMGDAVAYAASRPGVDPDRIGLFGYSMGATWALTHAPGDPRIKAVVSLSGPTNPRLAKAKLPPVLILHGADAAGPPESGAEAFAAALEEAGIPHGLRLYPGVGHNFPMTLFSDISRRSASFFDAHLKGPDPGAESPEGSAKGEQTPDGQAPATGDSGRRAASLLAQAKALEPRNRKAAIEYYREIVDRYGRTPEAAKARERLKALGEAK